MQSKFPVGGTKHRCGLPHLSQIIWCRNCQTIVVLAVAFILRLLMNEYLPSLVGSKLTAVAETETEGSLFDSLIDSLVRLFAQSIIIRFILSIQETRIAESVT